MITLRSSIKPELKKRALLLGTLLASSGGALLLWAGTFLSADQLTFWGLPVLAISMSLITLGLYPYKKLTLLETKPHEILIQDNTRFLYAQKGRPTLSIPFESLEKLEYLDGIRLYGIKIFLKEKKRQPITVKDPKFDADRFCGDSCKRSNCDLFLPYFRESAYRELQEFLEL